MSGARAASIAILLALVAAGCGSSSRPQMIRPSDVVSGPIPAGRGHEYRLGALSPQARQGQPIEGLSCMRHRLAPTAAHLELYARGLVLPVPAGIGIAPPVRRFGAYVRGGRCSYPVRTREPTGLLLLARRSHLTVGTLFSIWGRPLDLTHLAGFSGPVYAYLDGRRWLGSPRDIPLRRHAQIVLEADGYVPPHPRYEFPPGL